MKKIVAKHGFTIIAKSIEKSLVDTPTTFFANEKLVSMTCFIMDKECFETWYDYEI